jgi:undecaprenyl-diphosphatase
MSGVSEPSTHPARHGLLISWLVVLVVSGALFGWVTVAVLDASPAHPALMVDRDVLDAVVRHRSGSLTAIARTLTFLGSSPVLYAGLVVAVIFGWLRRSVLLPLCCLLWFAAGQLVRTGINQAIARPRPPADLHLTGAAGYAYPSGHTTSATIGYGLLAAMAIAYLRRHRARAITAAVVAAVVLAVGVGCSRVYLAVHWPSDVAGGWALGLAWLSLGAIVLRAIGRRSARREGLRTDQIPQS